MGEKVSPTVELLENDGEFTMKTSSAFKNSEIKFKLGEEFDEETPDGRKVKSLITIDGNKMLHVQKGDKETIIEREYGPTEMKAVSIRLISPRLHEPNLLYQFIYYLSAIFYVDSIPLFFYDLRHADKSLKKKIYIYGMGYHFFCAKWKFLWK